MRLRLQQLPVTIRNRILWTLCLLLSCLFGHAQIYPIDLSPQVVAPYDVYLPDYASPGSEKLRIVALQRDLTAQGYRMRLEMKIQVNGVTIMQTSPSAVPPPITLQPGIPTILSGNDLYWYVQPQNLEYGGGYSISTYEQTRCLPEGPITITFTAYDYTRTNVQVSQPASTSFYATMDNPPLINYPACGMLVNPLSPQFLNFSWLPQNTSSPNSALQTNYVFSIWTVQPSGYNYQDIVNSAAPLYSATVQTPNFVYGPAQPMLTPGMTYAWRVQAVDATGRDIFRNNGYSETCSFIYGSGDSSQGVINYPAIDINAVTASATQGKAWWVSDDNTTSLSAAGYQQYRLYYRKPQGDYDWFSVDVTDTMYRLFNLEPSTTYECRLQGYKAGNYGPYSNVASFTTSAQATPSCTDTTSMLSASSGRPLATATPGMTITYGPWNVQLLTVTPLSQSGQYKGTCTVTVPFMAGSQFNATFDNITIDDSRNVTAGNIIFASQGLQQWVDSSIAQQMGGADYGKVVTGADTTNVQVNTSLAGLTNLDITLGPDSTITSFTIPGTPPTVVPLPDGLQGVTIKDSTGSTYALDNQGNLVQLSVQDNNLQNFFANPQNVASLNTLATGMGVVNFTETDGTYAFDSWKSFYSQGSSILTSQYEKLTGGNGNYYVAQKAIGAGASDIVGLDIELPDNMNEDSLVFSTSKGVHLIWDSSDYTLNLVGGPDGDAQEIYALYPKPGGGYYSLGKLLVSGYAQQNFTVMIVPVAGGDGVVPQVNTQEYEDSLNSIYNKINIFWTVTQAPAITDTSWDTDLNGKLTMSGSSFLSNKLVGEPAALIKQFKTANSTDNSTRYIFVLNTSSGSTGDASGLAGDMPRGTQYAFVFLDGNNNSSTQTAITIAHELGHGQFNLEHTFSADIALGSRGATSAYPNLMDYTGSLYNHLYKYEWNQAHEPGQVLGIFENDTAGQSTVVSSNVFKPFANADSSYTFIAPSGLYITLPKDVGDVYFSTYDKLFGQKNIYYPPIGSLISFVWRKNTYLAVYSNGNFAGYECNPCTASCDTCQVIKHYTESLSYSLQPQSGIILLTAVEDSTFVGYAGKAASPVTSSPRSIEDGSGAIGKGVFILGTTGDQLSSNYKDYFSQVCGGNILRLTDIRTWVGSDYDVVVDSARNITAQGYLKVVLNTNSTLADLLTHSALVFEGAGAISLFQGCTDEEWWKVMKKIAYSFQQKVNQGVVTMPAGLVDRSGSDNLETELASVGEAAVKDLEGASQLEQQVENAKTIVDVYTAITQHYDNCTFKALDSTTRTSILNWILNSGSSYWSWNDSNIVYAILRTTPANQQMAILRGFMANQYSWTYYLWHTGSYAYVTPVINLLSSWIGANYANLNITPTTDAVQFNNITNSTAFNLYSGDEPYLVGLENNQVYNLPNENVSVNLGPYSQTESETLTGSGTITFKQNYVLQDITPTISSTDNPVQPITSVVYYNAALNPFEPMRIIFMQDHPEIGVSANTPYVVPAIWGFWAAKGAESNFSYLSNNIGFMDYVRTAINTAAILTAVESDGASLELGSLMTKMLGVAAGVDQTVLTAQKSGVIPASQLSLVNAWENFYTGMQMADGVLGLAKTTNFETVASEWNQFDQAMQSSSTVDQSLVTAWQSIKALDGSKVVADALFTDVSALTAVTNVSGNVIADKLGNQIMHLTSDGVLHIDAIGSFTDDCQVLDIETNQTYVPQGSASPVTEDVVVIQKSDNSIVCVRGACFTAGTPVHTHEGLKDIEKIKENEEVLSVDLSTGQSVWEKVTRVFSHQASKLVRLITGKDTLLSTPDHPYYTEEGWKSASAIKPGWRLKLASGLFATALSTATIDTNATVYNFNVERTHTYCIGKEGIIVHNDCQIINSLKAKLGSSLAGEFEFDFSGNTALLTKFGNGTISTDAWALVRTLGQDFRTNEANLTGLTSILKNTDIDRTKLFTAIQYAVNNQAVVNGATLIQKISLFANTEGIEDVVANLATNSWNARKGAAFVLKSAENVGVSRIARFEALEYTDAGGQRYYDFEVYGNDGNVSVECKSWRAFYTQTIVSQFINKDLQIVTDFSELRYLIDQSGMSLDNWFTNMQQLMLDQANNIWTNSSLENSKNLFINKFGFKSVEDYNAFFSNNSNRSKWFDIIFNQNF